MHCAVMAACCMQQSLLSVEDIGNEACSYGCEWHREEGWAQGGIVVQDCMEFLNNLLLKNAPNQLMFRCSQPSLSPHDHRSLDHIGRTDAVQRT